MRLTRLEVTRVGAHSLSPVGNVRVSLPNREGLLIQLTDSDGCTGFGEASPLPGYSPDSLEDCQVALTSLSLARLEQCQHDSDGDFVECLAASAHLLPERLPAARFGLEMALLDLKSAQTELSPFALCGRKPLPRLAVNALVQDVETASLDQLLGTLQTEGYRTVKLKLGRDLERSLVALRACARVPGLKLRVDANQQLGREQLQQFLPALAALGLEFLEEPCPPRLRAALPRLRPPLALDESLQGVLPPGLSQCVETSGASVLVLKPMALGGLAHCLRLSDAARGLGVELVVTHLFDGPLALRAASVLALMVQTGNLAAGLAPHPGLSAWSGVVPSHAHGPTMQAGEVAHRLEPVYPAALEGSP